MQCSNSRYLCFICCVPTLWFLLSTDWESIEFSETQNGYEPFWWNCSNSFKPLGAIRPNCSTSPFSVVSLAEVSVTSHHLWSKDIKFTKPSTLSAPTSNHQHHHGSMTKDCLRQMVFLVTHPQQVNSSLKLCHDAYKIHLTLSHHIGALSSHHIGILASQGGYSTGWVQCRVGTVQ